MGMYRGFRSPEKQASSVMKSLQKTIIRSVGTVRNFESALRQVARSGFCQSLRLELRDMTQAQAIDYLTIRSGEVKQKTLDMERQALQKMMQYVSHKLPENERLPVIKSGLETLLPPRAYTPDQVERIVQHQQPGNALATRIAYAAGLRAHELLTLRQASEQPPNLRPALDTKFLGREGERYTVIGKGGLIREVRIPGILARELEAHRLESPKRYTDRNIHYTQYYNLNGGNRWSVSFKDASKEALGWSNGAHGLRHAYAQERMIELQVNHHIDREKALETVSQEMGHFRPDITETYLR